MPKEVAKCPGLQNSQLDDPNLRLKFPAAHGRQLVLPTSRLHQRNSWKKLQDIPMVSVWLWHQTQELYIYKYRMFCLQISCKKRNVGAIFLHHLHENPPVLSRLGLVATRTAEFTCTADGTQLTLPPTSSPKKIFG